MWHTRTRSADIRYRNSPILRLASGGSVWLQGLLFSEYQMKESPDSEAVYHAKHSHFFFRDGCTCTSVGTSAKATSEREYTLIFQLFFCSFVGNCHYLSSWITRWVLSMTTSVSSSSSPRVLPGNASNHRATAGMQAMAAMWTLTILSIFVVATRCYTQHFISRQLGLSDALVILAVLLLIINVGLIHVSYHYGWGRHQIFLTAKNMNQANKYTILNAGFGMSATSRL